MFYFGNITTLQRYGRTGASTYGRIDYLALTYSGNRLSTVKDTGSAAYGNDFRYSNTTSTTYSYTHDAAGRMTKDAAKGISSIIWNVLGLPQRVTFSNGNVINYSYAADGTKLRESKTVSGTTTTADYTGTLVLEDGTRSRMLFDGGYVSMSDNAYHFFITDHLGSVRVVANSNGVAEEYNHYYPLGGLLPTSTSITGIQPVKYQGKEWGAAKGLNLYDFGARRYDPATGRWLSQDPLAEKYYGHSPYLFCAANPMRYVDPEGKDIWTIYSNGQIIWKEQNDRHYLYYEDEYGKRTNQYVQFSSPEIMYGLEYYPEYDEEERHIYMSQSKNANDVFKVFKFAADHSNKEWVVHKNKDMYTIGTILDPISSASYQDYGLGKPDASIHSHPEVEPSLKKEIESMGYNKEPWGMIYDGDAYNARHFIKPKYNYVYFPNSSRIYNIERDYPRFIRSISSIHGFYFGTLNDK